MTSSDVDWIKKTGVRRAVQCTACRDPLRKRLVAFVKVLVSMKATHVTVTQVHERMCEIDPKFGKRVTAESLQRHFRAEHDGSWR